MLALYVWRLWSIPFYWTVYLLCIFTAVCVKSVLWTRKTVLDRGSRSDQLRYHAHTRWTLTFDLDLDFQSKASYGHDPRTQNTSSKVSRLKRYELEQPDGRTDASDWFTFTANQITEWSEMIAIVLDVGGEWKQADV